VQEILSDWPDLWLDWLVVEFENAVEEYEFYKVQNDIELDGYLLAPKVARAKVGKPHAGVRHEKTPAC